MIDNYDSFVYNLVMYFRELDVEIEVKKNDEITLEEIQASNYQGIIISPGPKRPEDSGISQDIIKYLHNQIPILGICLGHQTIAQVFGGKIIKGKRPMHGKISILKHNGRFLFANIPNSIKVTRYHSLIVEEKTLSRAFVINARSEDRVIMAISHKQYPLYGLQFHPEALLTEYGHEILDNFICICSIWRENHGS